MAASTSKSSNIKACEEVLVISTLGVEGQNWNVGVWNAHTGNLLQTYRNGSAASNSLCMLGGECLMAASCTKPVIHVWSMLRQGQKHRKLICGGKVSCLTVTPDGVYVAAGIEDKIHIWQVSTGELFVVLTYNSVEVTRLKFSPSGQHLVSGCRDGAVAVWELQDVLHQDPMRVSDHSPVKTFLGHAGEITDLHVTLSNRVVSSALDFTVRIWNLLSQEELKMFELGAPVSSVVVDHAELALYAGDTSGNIYCIDLHYKAAERSVHVDTRETNSGFTFHKAHTSAVVHMSLTLDQSKLVTASDDKTVKVWSMMSSVAALTITLNDRVSNLMVTATPLALLNPELKPRAVIGNLKRHLHGTDGEDNCDDIFLDIVVPQKVSRLCNLTGVSWDEGFTSNVIETTKDAAATSEEVESLKQMANKLKKANEEIYHFALKEIVK